ncbi:NAD-dependent epimerase/dehydratase family protein [Streptomyces asiaticus]
MSSTSTDTVLVTGGSGFLGGRVIAQALGEGYQVRTTVRSLSREARVREDLEAMGGGDAGERLTFVTADLTADEGWAEAVAGCRYVLHTASLPGRRARPRGRPDRPRPGRHAARAACGPRRRRRTRRGHLLVRRHRLRQARH